ncbi:MAG: hypothetical protein HY825_16975 [Acidobacteria bacterium]|nr:hypothetical protein [Acidobacteriota bacterium]
MGGAYPLLDVDPKSPPQDFSIEIPLPMLGADPAEKDLTPRVAYLFSRIDGNTSLGELLDSLPMPPKALFESLLLLHAEGLVGFSEEFEGKYLKARPPVRTSVAPGATPPGQSAISAGARATAAPEPVSFTPPRSTPLRVTPAQVTVAPDAGRAATFTIAPSSSPSSPPASSAASAKPPPMARPLSVERTGELAARPLARLARHLGEARYSGVVTLKRAKATKHVQFFGGDPTYADSDVPDEEVGILMHKRGKIDDRRLADYQAARKAGKTPMAALMELGAVTPADAPRADRWRAQAVLFDALLWREGTYELGEPGKIPADAPRYDLGLPTLVVKAWREAPFDDKRKKYFEEHRNWYLVPSAVTPETIARMKLNPKEERLFNAIQEQTRRIRDIFELTSLFINETYRFIDGLLAMGLAELSEKNPTEAGPVDAKDIPEQFQCIQMGNYFERLSAHPISTDQDIEDALARVTARYHPRYYSNLRPATKATLEKMMVLITEAYEHLKDAKRRKEYRNKTYDRPRLEYFSDIQFRKGEIFLFWRDDPKTAFAIFESSWEMCPDIPLYAVSYALAAIRAHPGDRKRAAEAKAVLDRALARQDLAAKVVVIGAAAVRALGDVGRSELLCRQALKVSGNAPEIVHLVEQVRKQGQPGGLGGA